MSAERWFFDTNVLVYLFDANSGEKRHTARSIWTRAIRECEPVVSTQVLQEFFVTVTKRAKTGLSFSQARAAMREFEQLAEVRTVSRHLVFSAIDRVETSGFSFWDSLIVESALSAGASRLWTEDLQHGQMIGQMEIINPFHTI